MNDRSAGTPALRFLRAQGIAHEVHRYRHEPGTSDFGDEAAAQLTRLVGCDPSAIFKTLVWLVDGRACFAIAPVTGQVAAKRLAAALDGRSAVLADEPTARRISGSTLGAISPIAPRRAVPVVIDVSAHDHDRVFLSAGQRGVEVALAPADLIAATDATVAAIARGSRDS